MYEQTCGYDHQVKQWKAKRVETRAAAMRATPAATNNAASANAMTTELQRIAASLTPLRGTTASTRAHLPHNCVIDKSK